MTDQPENPHAAWKRRRKLVRKAVKQFYADSGYAGAISPRRLGIMTSLVVNALMGEFK